MTRPKGGRGHVVPYETTHLRVPVPIKHKIQRQIDDYKALVLGGDPVELEEGKDKLPNTASLTTFNEAIAISRDILKSKKSARESIAKLLTALYEGKVDPDLLK